MGYRIENKAIDAKEIRQLSKIATGKTGNVYHYRNEALKIFVEGEEPPIEEGTARYLQDISTSRILLPKKLLFYNTAFRGYTLKLIPKKGLSRKIVNTDKGDLLSEIFELECDTEVLSRKKILLNGISPENSIFNGKFFITDPSKYRIFDIDDTEELAKLNKYQLQLLLNEIISSELGRMNYTQKQIRHIKEILSLRDADESICEFYDKIIDGERNVKQLVKKMGL